MRLLTRILDLTEDKGRLLAQSEAPWRTAMFEGSRHTATLYFAGAEAIAIGEAFLLELPNFPDLPGHKVVEAKTVWVNRTANPGEMTCQVELLLLDEGKAR